MFLQLIDWLIIYFFSINQIHCRNIQRMRYQPLFSRKRGDTIKPKGLSALAVGHLDLKKKKVEFVQLFINQNNRQTVKL